MNRAPVIILMAFLSLLGVACGRQQAALEQPADSEQTKLPPGAPRIVKLDLSLGLPESADAGGFFPLPEERTYFGLLQALERIAGDEAVKGVYVELGERSVDFAHAEGLGAALERLKVPVTCHSHGFDNQSAWLAAKGCKTIWLSPAGSFDTVGLAAQTLYLGEVLEKLGVQADFVSAGQYKSFAEMFTRTGPSDAAREALMTTLRSIRTTWLEESARHRKGAANLARDFESGPFTPDEAKARGLVDQIGYAADALERLKEAQKTQAQEVRFGPEAQTGAPSPLAVVLRTLVGQRAAADRAPHVALVPAIGGISMSSGGAFEADGITAKAMQRTLARVRKDPSVKAVVLRIDSPGGSALASDLIWKDLMELRKEKPVVASIGSMAASGGYYMAAAANRIIAAKSSIVGSIGVVGGKFSVGNTLTRVGVHPFTLAASDDPDAEARAAYLSAVIPWNDTVKERVQAQIRSVYQLFLNRVAEGRGQPVERVRASAEGRIWSGVQGRELGLVDEFGGLSDALAEARRLADLPEDAPVTLEGQGQNLLELLVSGETEQSEQDDSARLRLAALARGESFAKSMPKAWQPYLNAINAMAQGEQVLALSPYLVLFK